MKYLMMIVTVMVIFISACSETQETITPVRGLPTATLEDNHEIPNTNACCWN
jgi:hypothetical protein